MTRTFETPSANVPAGAVFGHCPSVAPGLFGAADAAGAGWSDAVDPGLRWSEVAWQIHRRVVDGMVVWGLDISAPDLGCAE